MSAVKKSKKETEVGVDVAPTTAMTTTAPKPSDKFKSHLDKERRKIAQRAALRQKNFSEIPYTFPPYTGGTGISDATELWDEMKNIVETKTKQDPTCWNNITLISLRFETGPHFGVSFADAQSAREREKLAAAGLEPNSHDGKYIPDPDQTIFVGGVPNQATEDDIRSAFIPHRIKFVQRPVSEKNPQLKKPIAFVEFFDKATADAIRSLAAGSVTIAGVPVRISQVEREKFDSFVGGGGAGATDHTDSAAAGGVSSSSATAALNPIDLDPTRSRVVSISGLLDSTDGIDDDFVEAIGTECSKFGNLLNICFYRPADVQDDAALAAGIDDESKPRAAVEFEKASEALACSQKMNGRMFDKRVLVAGLMNMDMYFKVSKH
jgi:hypothetical protein